MALNSKLAPTWLVGERTLEAAYEFMGDLEPRLKNTVQLSTDGHPSYREAVPGVFGDRAYYGVVEK